MPATLHPVVPVDALSCWICRLNHLRDDVGFGLDPRGVLAQLADLLADMQTARSTAEK